MIDKQDIAIARDLAVARLDNHRLFGPTMNAVVTHHTCDGKRMADGRRCGKPAKYRAVWDHPERFEPRYFCGTHKRYQRTEPLPLQP